MEFLDDTDRNLRIEGRQQSSTLDGEIIDTVFQNDPVDSSETTMIASPGQSQEVKVGFEQQTSNDNNQEQGLLALRERDGSAPDEKDIHSGIQGSTQRQPMKQSNEIKDLGRKARERLEQERQKRKEVVILDQIPQEQELARKAIPILQPRIPSKRPKAATSTTAMPSKKRKRPPTNPEIDPWVTCVSHIPILPKEERSTVVRMHSLPVGCTAAQIRRFFSGLNPERIFMIPTNEANIPFLDGSPAASDDKGRRVGTSGPIVDRYPTYFRVFVKFDSSPMAQVATERSGEPIMLQNDEEFSPSSDKTMKGATVAVTQVGKKVASFLLKAMSIETVRANPPPPLHEILSATESSLHPSVCTILWQSMSAKFPNIILQEKYLRCIGIGIGIGIDNESSSSDDNDDIEKRGKNRILIADERMRKRELYELQSDSPTTYLTVYQKLAIRHNRIVQLLNDELLNQIPYLPPSSLSLSSSSSSSHVLSAMQAISIVKDMELMKRDAVIRLTTNACSLLQEEIQSIEQLLHRSRINKLYSKHCTSSKKDS